MEDKKYEAGRVEISSAEYRDLVTKATENRIAASDARSEKWKLERERDDLKKELESARAQITELKKIVAYYQQRYEPIMQNPVNNSFLNMEDINNG